MMFDHIGIKVSNYAAFVHDPDGNNVEVGCLKEKG